MNFGQPHRVKTPAFSRIDLFERGRERLLVADPGGPLKFVKHAELETHHSLRLRSARPGGAQYGDRWHRAGNGTASLVRSLAEASASLRAKKLAPLVRPLQCGLSPRRRLCPLKQMTRRQNLRSCSGSKRC